MVGTSKPSLLTRVNLARTERRRGRLLVAGSTNRRSLKEVSMYNEIHAISRLTVLPLRENNLVSFRGESRARHKEFLQIRKPCHLQFLAKWGSTSPPAAVRRSWPMVAELRLRPPRGPSQPGTWMNERELQEVEAGPHVIRHCPCRQTSSR